jgi:hypothetical protein
MFSSKGKFGSIKKVLNSSKSIKLSIGDEPSVLATGDKRQLMIGVENKRSEKTKVLMEVQMVNHDSKKYANIKSFPLDLAPNSVTNFQHMLEVPSSQDKAQVAMQLTI